MGSGDPYNRTDKLEETLLEALVARLEARGKHHYFQKMMHEYFDMMEIDTKDDVLDMGCGTGVAARAVAARPGFSGKVLGIDKSPFLVQAAERISKEEGDNGRVTFQVGDSGDLNLEDNRFDAVIAHTLVSHVDDPSAVIKEAARLVRPGGMVGIFDGDYASMTFGQKDPIKNKHDDERLIKSVVTNPYVMRQMPRLLKEAGLESVACFPYVLAEIGKADFWLPGIESFKKIMPAAGEMSDQEAAAWAEGLMASSKEGTFFGASNYYGYVARKP
ncbi:MAG: methyltransferase domain-containing protein [Deltaproteobacteria bacterium]|nr:methyltransferase domain-containing protein [Deltaproteobacteria bacterium]